MPRSKKRPPAEDKAGGSSNEGAAEGSSPSKKKALDSKFGGMTEEQVMELLLPDHLAKDLDIIFIGINPGLYSAYTGHHYSNRSNHFWPCLFQSGLIPRPMTAKDDAECLSHGIGFTNIVPRTTRSSNDLTRQEVKQWSKIMLERMAELKPLVLCFNGKGIYEVYSGKKCEVGVQEDRVPGTDTVVYVMPSTSGRAASHPRRVDKLVFFHELKRLVDGLKQRRSDQTGPTVPVSAETDEHPPPLPPNPPPSIPPGNTAVEVVEATQALPPQAEAEEKETVDTESRT